MILVVFYNLYDSMIIDEQEQQGYQFLKTFAQGKQNVPENPQKYHFVYVLKPTKESWTVTLPSQRALSI